MNEFKIINNYFKTLTNNSVGARKLEDDTATVKIPPNCELVVSKDMMIENVHFLKKDGGYKIATKLLASNLSDIAASGATPLYYMLGFSKNKHTNQNFIKNFTLGLKDVQKKYGIYLIGGDTVKSDKALVFSVTIFGYVKKNKILLRDKAAIDDLILVTGNIGDAYLGLKLLTAKNTKEFKCDKDDKNYLLKRHHFPDPKIDFAKSLIKNNLSSSAIDISDGLIADLNHICQASKLKAAIYQDKIPLSKAAKKFLSNNRQINFTDLISGGDDYELIFTAKAKNLAKIMTLAKKLKISVNCIGNCQKSDKTKPGNLMVELYDEKGKPIQISKYGYQH